MSVFSTRTDVIFGVTAGPNLEEFANKSQFFIFPKFTGSKCTA